METRDDDLSFTGGDGQLRISSGRVQYYYHIMDRDYLYGSGDVLYLCKTGTLFIQYNKEKWRIDGKAKKH